MAWDVSPQHFQSISAANSLDNSWAETFFVPCQEVTSHQQSTVRCQNVTQNLQIKIFKGTPGKFLLACSCTLPRYDPGRQMKERTTRKANGVLPIIHLGRETNSENSESYRHLWMETSDWNANTIYAILKTLYKECFFARTLKFAVCAVASDGSS